MYADMSESALMQHECCGQLVVTKQQGVQCGIPP